MKVKTLNDVIALMKMVDNDNGPQGKVGFDMKYACPDHGIHSGHPCGTACCIGGWVRLVNEEGEAEMLIGSLRRSRA